MGSKLIPRMARFFAGLSIDDLNPDVVERTKVCIMDAISAAYAGHKTAPARMEADAGMSAMDSRIRFVAKTGQVFTGDLALADFTGFVLNKASAIDKFHFLAGEFIDGGKIDEISDMVFHPEDLKDISELTKRLTL